MLQATEKAVALLRAALEDRDQACAMTFRLVEKHDGFGLAFDTPDSGDLIFTCEGQDILCVSPTIAEHASEVIIDAGETPEERGLTFSVQSQRTRSVPSTQRTHL